MSSFTNRRPASVLDENTETSPFTARRPTSVLNDEVEATAATAPRNFKKGQKAGMTFNVPPEWHRRFKADAARQGKTMHEFLFEVYAVWQEAQGRKRIVKGD